MKFSIRDVLFATAISALIVGWWLDRTQLAKQVQATGSETQPSETLELVVAGKNHDELLLFNSRTGETWKRYDNGNWLSHAGALAGKK